MDDTDAANRALIEQERCQFAGRLARHHSQIESRVDVNIENVVIYSQRVCGGKRVDDVADVARVKSGDLAAAARDTALEIKNRRKEAMELHGYPPKCALAGASAG